MLMFTVLSNWYLSPNCIFHWHLCSFSISSGIRVAQSLVFCLVFCSFILFLLAIAMSVLLRFTSHGLFVIFKLSTLFCPPNRYLILYCVSNRYFTLHCSLFGILSCTVISHGYFYLVLPSNPYSPFDISL